MNLKTQFNFIEPLSCGTIRIPKGRDTLFPVRPAMLNFYSVKCEAYLSGAKNIYAGSAGETSVLSPPGDLKCFPWKLVAASCGVEAESVAPSLALAKTDPCQNNLI